MSTGYAGYDVLQARIRLRWNLQVITTFFPILKRKFLRSDNEFSSGLSFNKCSNAVLSFGTERISKGISLTSVCKDPLLRSLFLPPCFCYRSDLNRPKGQGLSNCFNALAINILLESAIKHTAKHFFLEKQR